MVGQQHRLRALQMRVPGDHDVRVSAGERDERPLEGANRRCELCDRLAAVEP